MALTDVEECKVKLPTDEKVSVLKESVVKRRPSLKNVFCVADGLKIPLQSCSGLNEQSIYFNGWQHGHYITNLFVFSMDGLIIDCVMNVPGSVHDSTIAIWGGTYIKLKELYERNGGICCVDSAFAAGHAPYPLKSAQDINSAKDAHHMVQLQEATSLRQVAEWGMRAIQGSMPRLKDHMMYEENGERKRIMKLIPKLYNLRVARVGLNQIANTYVPAWTKNADFIIN